MSLYHQTSGGPVEVQSVNVKRDIADGYSQIDYIQNNIYPQTYIDTSLKWSEVTKIEASLSVVTHSSNGKDICFCSFINGAASAYLCLDGTIFDANGNASFSDGKFVFTGSSTNNTNILMSTWSDDIFGGIYNWKYVKMYGSNNDLLRYFIPAVKKSDNSIGMYDIVSQEFYSNSGTGSFVIGSHYINPKYIIRNGKLVWADPNIYLQSDGAQWIDTDFYAGSKPKVETSFQYTTSDQRGLMGFSAATACYWGLNWGNFQLDSTTIVDSPSATGKHLSTFSIDIGDNIYTSKLNVDNGGIELTSYLTFDNVAYRLFGLPYGEYRCMCKIYFCKMYHDNVLQRHLVPVPTGLQIGNYTVPSNGMFDIVTQTFFGNAGSGDFTVGRDE